MPMIDLTTCEGALTEAALDDLSGTLMRALLRAEGVPEEAAAKKSISWFFVNELPARRMYGGARELSGRRPLYRLDIGIPAGVLDLEHRAAFVADATRLILEAAHDDPDDAVARAHVWVLFHESKEGTWGAGGTIMSLADIGKAVGASPARFAEAGVPLTSS